MAAVALKREIEGYQDVVSQYQREARKYRGAAAKHNAAVDAYNNALKTGMDRYPANYLRGYGNKPVVYTPYVGMGSRVEYFYDPELNDRQVRQSDINAKKWVVGAAPGGGYYIYRNLPSAPGAFTQKPPEEPKSNPAKDYTASQLKSLDEPSLTDVERTGGSGLISSAFNY
jgi:hypothetical protein